MSGKYRKLYNRRRRMRGYKVKLCKAIAMGTDEQVQMLVSTKGDGYLEYFTKKHAKTIAKHMRKTYNAL